MGGDKKERKRQETQSHQEKGIRRNDCPFKRIQTSLRQLQRPTQVSYKS